MPIFIDIEAFKVDKHIYVEVKCFPRANRTQELHIAFGQYVIYREVLTRLLPNTSLYLAVPHNNPDLASPNFQAAIITNHVKMIFVDMKAERIVAWNE
jgi:XisH protein